jgi:hypothetical protein
LTAIPTEETRHLHMVPYQALFCVSNAGGDYGPGHPLRASGVILPLRAHLEVRSRGDMRGERDLIFIELVMRLRAGVPGSELADSPDYQIKRQEWTAVLIFDTYDLLRRIIAQGEGIYSQWLVELVLLAGPRREVNIDGRPEDRIYRILHIICDNNGLTYNFAVDRTGWMPDPIAELGHSEVVYFRDQHFEMGCHTADIMIFSPKNWRYPPGPYPID